MNYIGWQKRVKNERKLDEEKVIDVYVFNHPELVKYDTGFIGVHPKNNDYKHWQIVNDVLCEEPKQGLLYGLGIHRDCLSRINKRTSLSRLSERIGIKREQFESILSNS